MHSALSWDVAIDNTWVEKSVDEIDSQDHLDRCHIGELAGVEGFARFQQEEERSMLWQKPGPAGPNKAADRTRYLAGAELLGPIVS
jgi:hypothetical protein